MFLGEFNGCLKNCKSEMLPTVFSFKVICEQKSAGNEWGRTKTGYANIFWSILGLQFKAVKCPFSRAVLGSASTGSIQTHLLNTAIIKIKLINL